MSLRGRGNQVTSLCDAPTASGATWDPRGRIYFTYGESRLAWVSEQGGAPTELGDVGDVHSISALPDGRGLLLSLHGAKAPSTSKDTSRIAVLMPDDRTVQTVLDGGYSPSYFADGYLLFIKGGDLFAAGFDLETFEATSPPVNVQPDVQTDSIWGSARYATAKDGTLVFAGGGDFAYTVPTWIDLETGDEEPLPIAAGFYNTFNLSPDGKLLAIQVLGGVQDYISIFDSRSGTSTRLTEEGAACFPAWSHDGREVFFASNRDGEYRLFRKPVDGSAPASRLLTDEQEAVMGTSIRWPKSATPDGRELVIDTWAHPTQGGDLWRVPLDGGDPQVILDSEVNDIIPQVSPDGEWLTYITNRSGDYRTMIRRFGSDQGREWVVSGPGGYDPRWSPDGKSIYYRNGPIGLTRVPVIQDGKVSPGIAQQVLQLNAHDSSGPSFAVSPDGRRILINRPVEFSLTDEKPITLVTGWAQEVRRMVREQ